MTLHLDTNMTTIRNEIAPCNSPGPYGCAPGCHEQPVAELPAIPELVFDEGHIFAGVRLGDHILTEFTSIFDVENYDCDPMCCHQRCWTIQCNLNHETIQDCELTPPADRDADEPISDEERTEVLHTMIEHLLTQHPDHRVIRNMLSGNHR